jgi:hypothetical protein
MINEDLQAILDALLAVPALTAAVSDVAFKQVEPGTPRPYVLLHDVISNPLETFGFNVAAFDGVYVIQAITEDTADDDAPTLAGNILKIVYQNLHGIKIPVANNFVTLALRQGPREPSYWENVSSEERYFHMGFKWFGSFTKSA